MIIKFWTRNFRSGFSKVALICGASLALNLGSLNLALANNHDLLLVLSTQDLNNITDTLNNPNTTPRQIEILFVDTVANIVSVLQESGELQKLTGGAKYDEKGTIKRYCDQLEIAEKLYSELALDQTKMYSTIESRLSFGRSTSNYNTNPIVIKLLYDQLDIVKNLNILAEELDKYRRSKFIAELRFLEKIDPSRNPILIKQPPKPDGEEDGPLRISPEDEVRLREEIQKISDNFIGFQHRLDKTGDRLLQQQKWIRQVTQMDRDELQERWALLSAKEDGDPTKGSLGLKPDIDDVKEPKPPIVSAKARKTTNKLQKRTIRPPVTIRVATEDTSQPGDPEPEYNIRYEINTGVVFARLPEFNIGIQNFNTNFNPLHSVKPIIIGAEVGGKLIIDPEYGSGMDRRFGLVLWPRPWIRK